MANRLQFCTALLLSMSVFVTGCTVDIQDPNEQENDPTDPSTTNTAPVIELMGESVITIPVNTSFVEPGVSASDAEDGDLTSAVYSNSMQVNASQPGEYEIIYRVTDSGNMAAEPVKRIVIVSEPAVTPEEPTVEPGESETLVPGITDLKLVGYTGHLEYVELGDLTNGISVDLSNTSVDLLNIVADSKDAAKTGSVHFKLTGPIDVDRWENHAIYTMVVDTVNLSVSKGQFPVGDYTLSVTPYSLADMAGVRGTTKTISFAVSDSRTVVDVPELGAIDLVAVSAGTGEYSSLARLEEGAEIDLGSVSAEVVNLVAISEDATKTGSVHFSLSGPLEIERADNSISYSLQDESMHLNLQRNELPVGDYTLVATPYAEPNAAGVAGIPLMLNFSVIDSSVAQEPEVTPLPVAAGDSYTFFVGSASQPGQERALSDNDTFLPEATFTITKAPTHGSATMLDLGFFTYVPDPGFAGTDTFTYQIAQAGKTSSADVSINVVASTTGSSSGFTVIKPSADSKLIYVSSSVGNDSNDCLSEASPCKTVVAGLEKMRDGYPDHLYLKRGDVWREQRMVNLHSGRSASEPAVLSYYGQSGARPKLENSGNSIHIFKGVAMKNFHIIGLEFSAYKMDTKNPEFTGSNPADIVMLGGNQNLLFEDNKFNHLEIIIQAWDGAAPSNITLRRNIWTGAYYKSSSFDRNKRPSNIYADGVIGLTLEENVFDHGGWHASVAGAAANMYNHNVYLQKTVDGSKVVMRNNIITRGSSHGAQLRSGGLAENNFFGRNTVGLLIGYEAKAGGRAHAIGNVVSEGGTMVKGDKACSGVNLCTQAVWGLHIEANDAGDYQARDNIVSSRMPNDDKWSTVFSSLSVSGLNGLSDKRIHGVNNIEWAWRGAASSTSDYPAPGRTLGDYNKSLGGANSFDEFMGVVLNRPLGHWDQRYTASAINDFIRQGFGQ